MNNQSNLVEFASRHQWRSWLEMNHVSKSDAWLVIYKKKYADQGIALEEAVEEALCYGWIDGKMRSLGEKTYALRFSPRTGSSIWSISNIQRVERLLRDGRMTEAGRQKVIEAKENGQWEAAIRREQVDVIPEGLEKALQETRGGIAAYRALPDSRKKQIIFWLQSAKRQETKERRIRSVVEELLNG